jgi:Imidazolonepropionase and related amidohydrolases
MRLRLISLAVLLCFFDQSVSGKAPINRLLIHDVRVFDGEKVIEHRSVLIENGRIRRISGPDLKADNAEIISGRGRTLLPGLIDAHVHVAPNVDSALRQTLSFGVTTVLDMFTSPDTLKKLKAIRAEDPPNLADVRTAGIGATAPGGHPAQMGGPPIPTLTRPDQAQAFVDARIAEGSDYIKIIYDDLVWVYADGRRLPTLSKETLAALVKAAHRRGKLAVVHIHSEQQAHDAIDAGADGLAHMFMGELASGQLGQFAARHHAFVISTLSVLYEVCGRSDGAALLADSRLQPFIKPEWRDPLTAKWVPPTGLTPAGTEAGMRDLIRAQVAILAGTDSPGPGTTYGASLHGELALLVQDGLSPLQALAAATAIPARCFHLSDRGRIRPGLRADLVLVEGDPTQDILATRNIVAVFKKGIRVQH